MVTEQLYWRKILCSYFRFIWLWLLIAIMKRCTEQCTIQFIVPLKLMEYVNVVVLRDFIGNVHNFLFATGVKMLNRGKKYIKRWHLQICILLNNSPRFYARSWQRRHWIEAHLGQCQTLIIKLCRENSKQLKAVKQYLKKTITDIWRGLKYTSARAKLEHRSRASMTDPEEYPRLPEISNMKQFAAIVNGF